jgi:hypothetical protein
VNAKGRSEPVIIDDISFKGVAKFTGTGELFFRFPDPLLRHFIDIYFTEWRFRIIFPCSRIINFTRIVQGLMGLKG